jgi:YihY family inner membrane protein
VPTQKRSRRKELRKIVRTWVDLFNRHDLLTYASAIGLQAFVAWVALALLGLGVLAASGQQSIWYTQIAPQVQKRVLPGVFAGADQTVRTIFAHQSIGLIVFAAALAIWEVSGAVRACMGALTRVYDSDDDRPWWIRFPISFGVAVAITGALLGAFLLVVGVRHSVHGGWGLPFAFVRWIGTIVLLGLAFGLLVRYAPAEPRAKRWASGGAVLVVLAWLVESLIFRWYVTSVANFKTAPGSLAVFLVLTSYLYVGSIILLVGIELDELLREDVEKGEPAIHELVRSFF